MNISIFGFSGVIFVLFITKFVLIVYNSIAICDTYYFSPFHCTHCLCQHGKWYCKTFPIGNISTGIVFSLILPYQTLPQNSSKKSSCCERKSCIRYYLDCHTQTERLVEKQNAQLIGSSNVGYDGTHRGFGTICRANTHLGMDLWMLMVPGSSHLQDVAGIPASNICGWLREK